MILALDIGDSFQNFSDELCTWLPRLIGALVILLIFYVVARIVRKVIAKALSSAGIDRAVRSGRYGDYVTQYASGFTPSTVIATIGFWFVLLTGVLLALSTLGIEALDNAIASIVGYLPNVVAAIVILVVAIAIAGIVGGAITKLMGDTALGKIAASIVPVLVLTVAVFMALVQLEIATQIVVGMFYIVLGGIVLAAALAFGLGGRNAAQRLLDGAYEKGQQAMPQAKEELAIAKDRVAERKDQAQEKVDEKRSEVEGGSTGPGAVSGTVR
jgi:ABC-type multidrug transport system fused ATPase/permease subunit